MVHPQWDDMPISSYISLNTPPPAPLPHIQPCVFLYYRIFRVLFKQLSNSTTTTIYNYLSLLMKHALCSLSVYVMTYTLLYLSV